MKIGIVGLGYVGLPLAVDFPARPGGIEAKKPGQALAAFISASAASGPK
jgi:hypothetical protein